MYMHMRVDANGGFCMVSLDYRRISPIWIISSSKNGMTKQQRSRYIWKTISTGPDISFRMYDEVPVPRCRTVWRPATI
jgi:hypothetical protein